MKFIRDNVIVPFLLLSVVIVTQPKHLRVNPRFVNLGVFGGFKSLLT